MCTGGIGTVRHPRYTGSEGVARRGEEVEPTPELSCKVLPTGLPLTACGIRRPIGPVVHVGVPPIETLGVSVQHVQTDRLLRVDRPDSGNEVVQQPSILPTQIAGPRPRSLSNLRTAGVYVDAFVSPELGAYIIRVEEVVLGVHHKAGGFGTGTNPVKPSLKVCPSGGHCSRPQGVSGPIHQTTGAESGVTYPVKGNHTGIVGGGKVKPSSHYVLVTACKGGTGIVGGVTSVTNHELIEHKHM